MKQIAIPILKIDYNFQILSWNPSAEDFLKENFDIQLKSKINIDTVFPESLSKNFKTNFKNNEGFFYRTFTFSKISNIEISCSPSLNSAGEVTDFSICLKLVTIKETASPENIIQLRNILENSSLAIFLSDPKGFVIDVNKAACNMFGYSYKEFKKLKREDIMLDNPDLKKAVIQRNKTGELRSELTGIRKNGKLFPCEVHSVIYTNNYGEKRTSTAIVDISSRKKQELIAENSKLAFQSLFDHNPYPVYSFDLKGNFTSINRSALKLGEGSREEALRTNFLSLIPSYDQARVGDYFMKAVSGQVQHYQTKFISLQGNQRTVQVTNFPIYINNEIVGVYGIAKDITKQVNIEQKLREERNMFRAIIDYIPDHIFVVNEMHETILTNFSFYKNYLGVKNEQESLGLIASDYFPKQEAQKIMKDNTRVMEKGVPVINRGDIVQNFDGRKDYTLLTKVPFKFGDNKKGLVGISRNITEIREKEEALEKLNKELKKHAEELALSNKELEQFAYIASHDLQEPLRMVTSFIFQLKKKYESQLDEKAQQYIYFAHDGATRMRQIILDLLEYSRVGRAEYKLSLVNLTNLISDVLLLQKKCIEEKKAEIKVNTLPNLEAEEPLLRQLFSNLIGNALKYDSKERNPKIEISAIEKEEYWEFEISDNGIGIEEEFKDKIFEIFQRLHQRSEYEGTGIGLAICKKILDNFGGEIWVQSKYGVGSSFYFTIPKQF
ncbi:PAS domain S-box protein [Salegentibacter sp. Hel_I_6]|uniref:PAS domain-containing sensor histidine kinase n=1 Tax=Salegentibacter sp. Hel_I_6 TaxID=1250278 RepID=UPI0006899E91|nr:PAS domain S-box protein [Salegentibacter sp. Hel_I_6]